MSTHAWLLTARVPARVPTVLTLQLRTWLVTAAEPANQAALGRITRSTLDTEPQYESTHRMTQRTVIYTKALTCHRRSGRATTDRQPRKTAFSTELGNVDALEHQLPV